MAEQRPLIIWIENLRAKDVELAGGKGANLGELVTAGVPVPPGFVVTTEAYWRFMKETGLWEKISDLLKNLDVNDTKALEETSRKIREIILSAEVPDEIASAIKNSYIELAKRVGVDEPLVAVRSSASAEDLPEASFAGQQDTYLNVKGADAVVEKVKACWASLFTARAIFYRTQQGIDHSKVGMAVVVQKMVNSRSAGVMFTIHPATGDPNVIVIESSWGLGEAVVGGKVTPDEFIIDKKTLEIVEKKINPKNIMITYDPERGENVEIKLPKDKALAPSLSDEEAKILAKYGLQIEKHYGSPMDIEWAIDKDIDPPNNIFIVQARHETVWSKQLKESKLEKAETAAETEGSGKVLVRGLPASPGVATGVARVILDPHSPEAQQFKEGDILVTKMTDPDWVPLMKKAAAIVTDEGGMTSHAAIVSRELGIPAVVGTGNATQVIKTGMLVTVDGSRGVVYEGKVEIGKRKEKEETAAAGISAEALRDLYPVTGTKIYMNLGEPDVIDKYVDLPFDGIGLMRIEFILTDWIGYHPLYLLETGKADFFVQKLAEGIAKVASAIYPRPVVVRFSDFKTNEYRGLRGGEKYEPEERNPMIGWRGVSRYIHPAYEKAFRLEVQAIRKVRDEMGLKNVWVMLPFVRTTWEVEKVLDIIAEEGLERGKDFKVWIMAEVPSVVLLADEFAKLVDGFSIGSNDLTQLVLGVDRDSQLLAGMGYFDERDPAVLNAIKMLIDAAHRHGRTVSICGQAPSVYPEIVEFLVANGIDSISVNPDAVIPTRRLVASIERKIMMRRLEAIEKMLRKLNI
ncbi:phosphoenolpyruvate synthase [Pyrodictium abyssi]|uniref:Phosphoenolpyruvate synthase n=1 Tax=Pyrodictium abyssi TaxID=54256 RepID=A0ABN6ZM51_9CREN|nr:pyruvate, water dikinase [Pyrodictium abyssi]